MANATRKAENYGRGEHALDAQELRAADPDHLLESLRSFLDDDAKGTPMLPAAAQQALSLSQDPKADMTKMRGLIETEPLLAAKVVQLAQTAFYSAGAAIHSLDDALVRLGMRTLVDLFLQVAVTAQVFRAKAFSKPMDAIRRHSIACAHLTRKVCRAIGFPEEYAFLCGLLHDAGMAMCLVMLAEGADKDSRLTYEEVSWVVDGAHARASGLVARAWKLPDDIQLILKSHHDFEIDGRVHPLIAALCVADGLASQADFRAGDEYKVATFARALKALNLTPLVVESLRKDAAELSGLVV